MPRVALRLLRAGLEMCLVCCRASVSPALCENAARRVEPKPDLFGVEKKIHSYDRILPGVDLEDSVHR